MVATAVVAIVAIDGMSRSKVPNNCNTSDNNSSSSRISSSNTAREVAVVGGVAEAVVARGVG